MMTDRKMKTCADCGARRINKPWCDVDVWYDSGGRIVCRGCFSAEMMRCSVIPIESTFAGDMPDTSTTITTDVAGGKDDDSRH